MNVHRTILRLLTVLLLTFFSNSPQAALYVHHVIGSHSIKPTALNNVLKTRPALPVYCTAKAGNKKSYVKERSVCGSYMLAPAPVYNSVSSQYPAITPKGACINTFISFRGHSLLQLRGPPSANCLS